MKETPREAAMRLLDACNGEIRIQGVRYGGRETEMMCLVSVHELEEGIAEKFEDMLCGDNDMFEARDFLENQENQERHCFGFAYGLGPHDAMCNALSIVAPFCAKFCKDKRNV